MPGALQISTRTQTHGVLTLQLQRGSPGNKFADLISCIGGGRRHAPRSSQGKLFNSLFKSEALRAGESN